MAKGLFDLPPSRSDLVGDRNLLKKSKARKKASSTIRGGGDTLIDKISAINATIQRFLGKYEKDYNYISDPIELEKYIDKAIENGIISIDTETDSLDPITATIAGFSLKTYDQPAIYVPMNHLSYIDRRPLDNQLDRDSAYHLMNRIKDSGIKVIMTNAKFDIRVIRNQIGTELVPYWDTYIAARLLNENEEINNLKALHKKYCMRGSDDPAFAYDALFKGIPSFTLVPIKTGYLYAARDAQMTLELYDFQRPFLTEDDPICISRDLQGPAWVFRNIEMPLINIVADMEDYGISFDTSYANELSEKYHAKLEDAKEAFYRVCDDFGEDLDAYRAREGINNKLEYPINISSATQIAIMLYDVLKIPPVDPTKKRGTGEEILQKIDHPVARAILEYRTIHKLISTYIDKMPKIVNPKTKRIHANFNQIGADTGRFSSSDPNMQNIPSHNNEIRKMFIASPGNVLLSSDYSAQEPRLTAHMSKDEKMIQAYQQGKDLYVEVASIAYGLPYDECKEFREDGSRNQAGKDRRSAAKAIVLGVCYGKGVPAIADDLGIPKKKAQQIYDKIMTSFPGLKQFMEDSENMAREFGFVTTVWGRKRRLPNMQLPLYEFSYLEGKNPNFNPLFDSDDSDDSDEVDPSIQTKYINQLNRIRSYRDKEAIKNRAKAEGILIKDNGGYIAEATRQCVNSRIQGSAADQTKLAMILVGNDQRLKELGFKLLLAVHDELIGECPKENAKEVADRFAKLMIEAAKDLSVPSKCDVEITERWYGDPLQLD